MKGIELSRAFYEEYGRPMLESTLGEDANRVAVGLVGHGSECFGFDDEISTDHDFDAGFCMWLTDEDERRFGFKLERAYMKLPDTFRGVGVKNKSVFGTKNKGVHTISEFYRFYTGCDGAPAGDMQWLSIPSFYLAEATNGEVFCDKLGQFTSIRNEIINGMPNDVWLKKTASKALGLAQSGQYNFSRCLSHGENAAAAVALSNFCLEAAEMLYLLNRRHAPYYKWMFRGAAALPRLGETAEKISRLLTAFLDNNRKCELIEEICSDIIGELVLQGLADKKGDYLEPYAYMINEKIKNGEIRNICL